MEPGQSSNRRTYGAYRLSENRNQEAVKDQCFFSPRQGGWNRIFVPLSKIPWTCNWAIYARGGEKVQNIKGTIWTLGGGIKRKGKPPVDERKAKARLDANSRRRKPKKKKNCLALLIKKKSPDYNSACAPTTGKRLKKKKRRGEKRKKSRRGTQEGTMWTKTAGGVGMRGNQNRRAFCVAGIRGRLRPKSA